MGCDIHGNLERRPYKEDPAYWEDVQTIPNDRSYNTFSILANVRNCPERGLVTPISEPKGLPENVSYMTKRDSEDYGDDGHSHSWLTYQELAPRRDDFKDQDFKAFIDYMGILAKQYGEDGVRIVFWFDN